MKKATIVIALTAFLLLQSVVFTTQSNSIISTDREPIKRTALAYTPHGQMNISSNADFASEGWNGSGSVGDPYTFIGFTFDMEYAIQIENTTAYFSIESCQFGVGASSCRAAILIRNATNGNIQSCSFECREVAIAAYLCNYFRIQDNSIVDTPYGIQCADSSNFEISSNTIENVTIGLDIWFLTDSIITLNTIQVCQWTAMDLTGPCQGTVVSHNTITNVFDEIGFFYAISLDGTSNLTIESNTLQNVRSAIGANYGIWSCNVTGNEISDSIVGIGFFWGTDLVITSNSITNCSRGIDLHECDGFAVDSNIVSEPRLNALSISSCLHGRIVGNQLTQGGLAIDGFSPSHYRHEVSGNTVDDGDIGYFMDENHITVSESTYEQLILVNCTEVQVKDQDFTGRWIGIVIAFSERCGISNSEISDSIYGGVDLIFAEDCYISDCSIHEVGPFGYAQGGIYSLYSNGTQITNNMIYANNGSGIELLYSSYSTIYNNLITNNSRSGIGIWSGSDNNLIYGNAIGWNEEANAYDSGDNNAWDDGISLGNWWSDYNSSVSDVYEISDSQDNYPMEYTSWVLTLPNASSEIDIQLIMIAIGGVGIILVAILIVMKKKQLI
ncbi:MAG: right-handed parallel beta-helix repeat-containing protein [Candidatus Thorarchaeota archaeon]